MVVESETRWIEPLEEQIAEYRPVCGMAIVALLVGILSPLAFFHPILWLIPAAGISLALGAIWRIAQSNPPAVGRPAAVAALLLSVWSITAAPAYTLTSQTLLEREACQFAEQVLKLLTDDQPHKAYQLSRQPHVRLPLDDELWAVYARDSSAREDFEAFVQRPAVRTLIALGSRATFRHFRTVSLGTNFGRLRAQLIYAVTFVDEDGKKKSFFVLLIVERDVVKDRRQAAWILSDILGGFNPDEITG